MVSVNDFSFLIGGEAGAGISRSGSLFAKACMRGGLSVFGTNDYQSLIRGGHNFYIVKVSAEHVHCHPDLISLVIALNAETVMMHKDELTPNGGIIYDQEDANLTAEKLERLDVKLFPIPLKRIVREELKGEPIMRNTVALGAAIAVTNYDLTLLEEVLKDTFKAEVAESNINAVRIGYSYAKDSFPNDFTYKLKRNSDNRPKMFLSGNEAMGLGAIKAGCKFFACYPMTPTTGLLHFMAENERQQQMIVIQPEGEIAAANMVVGAAYAGVRAMTATSGGGFCLMTEAFGLAGMTETPIVIMLGQRPGPSTGLPTYSAQGDLRFALHAGQGEFPRVVIAPGDTEECFYETMRAFNWAEKYQLPVILLTDKYLVESERSVEPFDQGRVRIERGDLINEKYDNSEEYKRLKFTETGVSPRIVPSAKNAVARVTGDEHTEYGFTSEDPQITANMNEKRMRKLSFLANELKDRNIETTKFYGPDQATATVVSWGSTKGPIMEAMRLLDRESIETNYLQIIYLMPFPTSRVQNVLSNAKKTIIVENNMTSQLSGLIQEHISSPVDHKILKYDGRPFNAAILANRIKEAL